ncbi:hypothetical protein MIND_00934700 [Mycena indigotica]|uniref:Uncharacterized protein n=1 Tax=Mycena indigotica TaxID=2126181 RepID=A0A8H6SDM6_9AGAR|nr:uncharacterized protein MIND_00934700 [Mycena indigotica]KAF7297022.1 hypothetical protein MIND_00934700 [Mycena indigotica]
MFVLSFFLFALTLAPALASPLAAPDIADIGDIDGGLQVRALSASTTPAAARPAMCDVPCQLPAASTCDMSRPSAGTCCVGNVVQARTRCLNCEVFTNVTSARRAQDDFRKFQDFCRSHLFTVQNAVIDGTFRDANGTFRGPAPKANGAQPAAGLGSAWLAALATALLAGVAAL